MRWYMLLLLGVFRSAFGQNCRGDEPRMRECENLCDKNGANCRIKAALLLPQNTSFYANLPSVRPVFDLALADRAIKDALPGLDVELTTYDVSDCDAAYAVISAIDAYNDCAHVFFGPSCDFALASVARITKFLGSTGTPLITSGGFTFDFAKPKQNCHDEFYMMVRAGPLGFKDLAYFLISLMRHHHWKQLLLINDPESQLSVAGKSSCHLMMKTFANFLKIEDILYTPWDVTSDGGLNHTENLKFYVGLKYTTSSGVKVLYYLPRVTASPLQQSRYSPLDVTACPAFLRRYGWWRAILLYDTPAYESTVGGNGGHLMASTFHMYMLREGISVFGKELIPDQPHEEMLLQDVGNDYASECCLTRNEVG